MRRSPDRTDLKMAKADTADTKTKADKPVKTGKPGRAAKPEKPGVVARMMQYFRDVRSEMKRVVWPNRKEVGNMWLVVVATLAVFSVGIAAFDYIITQLLQLVARIG